VAVKVTDEPGHAFVALPPFIAAVVTAWTVTVPEAGAEQPVAASVTVTV